MPDPIEPTVQDLIQKPTKQKFLDFAYYHWQVILIIGLCFGVFVLHSINVSMNKKLDNLQSLQNVAKTVEALDAKLNDMKQREADLYPKLDAKIADLEQARLQFKAAEAKLKQPKIGDIENENKKLNEAEISRRLNALGLSTVVK